MIETIVIILAMLGCIGLGLLFGWYLWANDIEYYKSLSEQYKQMLNNPEVKEAILEKRIKNIIKNRERRYDTEKQ